MGVSMVKRSGIAAATLAFGAALGCGRSPVFPLFATEAGTTGGTTGRSSSGGSTGRGSTSGSGSAGGATSGSSSGTTGRATTGGSSGGHSGSSGAGASSGGFTSGGTTGGSTTSAGSTGSGSTGGATGAQCLPIDGTGPDLPPCTTTADCFCPTSCVFDPVYQQLDCEFPCQSSSDCPFFETACASNGFCAPNPCGGTDGSQNGSIDSTCTVAGEGPGSCVPWGAPQEGVTVNLCLQGGDTFGSCTTIGERSTPTLDCAAGLVCLPSGSPTCGTLCNPFGPNTCSFQEICTQPEPNNPLLGVCGPGQGTSGGNTGGGTTSGGSGNGGSSGGQPVCNPAASPVEFEPCTTVANCGCPMVCAFDPLAVEGGKGDVCEYPCQQLSQCPDLLTVCNGANCHLNGCGGSTGNGSYNSFCNVVGVDDGTCIPLQQANGTAYGVCAQGGSAETACNATANRSELSEDCVAGMVCIGGAIGTGGVCGDACDPNQGGPCPAGQDCAFTVDDPLAGACYTP
jgi:hypothetical protein